MGFFLGRVALIFSIHSCKQYEIFMPISATVQKNRPMEENFDHRVNKWGN